MKLYQYAVIYNPLPTKEQVERGEKAKSVLLIDVTNTLANNDKEAQMIAARAIPDTHIGMLDQIEIACRPF